MAKDLSTWTPRPRPSTEPLEGRFVRLEKLDPARHADGLFYGGQAPTWSQQTLCGVLRQFERFLGDQTPHGVHEMIVCAVEKPMLEVVMARAEGNQSRAAEWLGINRNTLRRKLLEHGLVR
mgnify:CR=1 FL=1